MQKKGSRQDVVIAKKGGQAGRGMATAHPALMAQKNKGGVGDMFFFKKRGKTGQEVATAHPPLMVHSKNGE